MSRTDAVEALYQDMAARHRSRFSQIHVRFPPVLTIYSTVSILTPYLDPESCGDREDRPSPPPLHQATPHQEPQVPSPPPLRQTTRKEDLRRQATRHFRLNVRKGWCMDCGMSCGVTALWSYGVSLLSMCAENWACIYSPIAGSRLALALCPSKHSTAKFQIFLPKMIYACTFSCPLHTTSSDSGIKCHLVNMSPTGDIS
jgi:hypothetical protein